MTLKKETNDYLKLIAKNSVIVFVAVVFSKLLSYFYKIIIARGFDPATFGLFSLGLIIIGIFGAYFSLGLPDGLLRYISFYRGNKESDKISFLVRNSTKITVFTSLVAMVALFFLADIIANKVFHEPELGHYLKILSLVFPFSALAGIFLSVIRAFEKIATYSFLVNITHNFFKVFFLTLLFFAGLRRDAILFSYVLAYVALMIISYFSMRSKIKKLFIRENISKKDRKSLINNLFSYSWPLVFSGTLLNLFFWIDSFILGIYTNAETVGLYGAAITLVGLFSIGQDLFMQLFIPVISKNLSLGKKDLIKELSKQIFKWIFIINLPLFILLFIFPGVVINIFFGAEYLGAQNALRILSLGALFSGFMSMFMGLINIKGNSKRVLSLFIIFSILNCILGLIFVKLYGLEGIAFATMIVWIIFTVTLFVQVKTDYGFYPIRRKAGRILIVSIVPSILLYYMSELLVPSIPNLIITGCVFSLLYGSLLIALKCLDRNDWEIINSIKDKFLKSKI